MNYPLSEILDVEQVSELLKSYTDATGLVSALLDLDGNILSQSGWQRICTDFHRVKPDTAKNCRTSDTTLGNKLVEGGEFNVYKCLNGLVDVAVPLKVNEHHIGNLFTGQFLLEPPDITYFEKQAEKYNFDKHKYLEALQEVPIIKIEEIRSKLNFLLQMTKVIAELGLAKIKQLEANVTLESSELKFRNLFENLNEGFALHEIITDDNGKPIDYRYLQVNPAFKKLTGIKEDLIGKTIREVFPNIENDPADWIDKYGEVALSGNDLSFEDYSEVINKWVLVHAFSPTKGQFAVTFTDITDRKKAEKLLIESEEYHKALFTKTNIGLALTSLDGQLVDVNSAFADIIGYNIEDTLKLSYWEITPKKYEKEEQFLLEKLNTIGSYGPYEKEYIHKDGRLIPVRLQGKIIEQKGIKYIWSSVENITKYVKTQEELKYSENKFRALVEQSLTGIYIFSKDKFIYVNQRFCNIFGYSEQEILDNLKPTDVVERQEREKAQKNIDDRLSGKVESTHYFAKGKRKDHKELWIEIHGTHIELEGEQVITGTVLDVTEGYKASLNIERSEQKFRSLFEQASAGVAIIETATGNYQRVNQKQCDIIGYTEEEILQLDFMKITHPDDLDEDLAYMERLKSGEIDSFMMEKRYFHKNGSIVWVNLNVSRIWLPGEEPLLHVALCEDITEKKKATEMLAISESRYRSVSAVSNTGAWEFHQKEKYLWCSPEYFEMLGRKPEDYSMEGKSSLEERWIHLIHPDDRQAATDHFANYLAEGSVGLYENYFRMSHANGSWVWIWSRGQTIRNTDESVSDITVGTHIDITESKRLQKELEIMNTELEKKVEQRTAQLKAANKELETFTYSVSHDLKAPLRGIDGYSRLLLNDYGNKLNEEATHFIKTIRSSTLQMNQLIDDLLKYSRLERLLIKQEKIDLKPFIDKLLDGYSDQIKKCEAIIKVEIPEKQINADSTGLSIALRNFIENALKFTTEKAKPIIEIGFEEKLVSWVIYVKDNGVGFDMKYHDRIFEIFQRLHRSEDYEGTGIGLALVTKSLQRMGGKAWAESSPEKGSTFFIEIPKDKSI